MKSCHNLDSMTEKEKLIGNRHVVFSGDQVPVFKAFAESL